VHLAKWGVFSIAGLNIMSSHVHCYSQKKKEKYVMGVEAKTSQKKYQI
jgi:hypothetical protein